MASSMDTVILKNINLNLCVGLDAWRRPLKPQPVQITIKVQPSANFEAAAAQDDVNLTLDYGKLYKRIIAAITNRVYPSAYALMEELSSLISGYTLLNVEILLPRALLQATGGVLYHFQIDTQLSGMTRPTWTRSIQRIVCSCIVGVNPHEREYKQVIYLDISVAGTGPFSFSLAEDAVDITGNDTEPQDMVRDVVERVEASSYQTVEALATAVAQVVTMNHGHSMAKILVEKPSAIATIDAAAVEITRSRSFFENKDFWKVKRP